MTELDKNWVTANSTVFATIKAFVADDLEDISVSADVEVAESAAGSDQYGEGDVSDGSQRADDEGSDAETDGEDGAADNDDETNTVDSDAERDADDEA